MRRRTALIATLALVLGGLAVPAAAHADTVTLDALESQLAVAAPVTSGYDRDLFGDWTTGSDGCNTRSDLLQAQSTVTVTFTSGSSCTVATGAWTSWYDGQTWTDAASVQIDHLVPLGEAWASGAANWTAAERSAFANDIDGTELQIVTSSVNESKGDEDPAEWMPPSASADCRYVTDWILEKYRWSLAVDSAEQSALVADLADGGCGTQTVTVPVVRIAPSETAPVGTEAQPVYRFWSDVYHSHFYTIDPAERDHVIATWPGIWTYEGARYEAFTTQVPGTVPLYRFWSARLGGHFYTADPVEKAHVQATYDPATWSYEEVAYYVYPADSTAPDTVAVSRFWSPSLGHHFYTADVNESNHVITAYPTVWSYEGARFRVPAHGIPVTVSFAVDCSAGTDNLLVTASNPNSNSVDVELGLDGNGDGVAEDGSGQTVAGYSSGVAMHLLGAAEGSHGTAIISVDGVVVLRQPYSVACSAPVVTPPPVTTPPAGTVTPGAFCSTHGAYGYSKDGVLMVCSTTATDSRYRWRAA